MTPLVVERVLISRLREDPLNARVHPERNIQAIKDSLEQHGQRKNVVAKRDGTVIAGSGTLRAAIALGWQDIMVGWFDGTEEEAVLYALADNRTGELAEWDYEKLRGSIEALGGSGIPASAFDARELEALINGVDGGGNAVTPVTAAKRTLAEGEVRCPKCGNVFKP